MIHTYTVSDPNNPDVLLEVDVEEEDHASPINYRVGTLDSDPGEQAAFQNDQRKFLLESFRYVYDFVCTYASTAGYASTKAVLRDSKSEWENQQVWQMIGTKEYYAPETSEEVLRQTLNGAHWGVLQRAYFSLGVLRQRKITLSQIIDCLKPGSRSDPDIVTKFLNYAVTLYKASNVAGFSAQPARIYTGRGAVALNVHAGTQHRQEIQMMLNYSQLWFVKVQRQTRYDGAGNEIAWLEVVSLTPNSTGNPLQDFARNAYAARGFRTNPETSAIDWPDPAVKLEKP